MGGEFMSDDTSPSSDYTPNESAEELKNGRKKKKLSVTMSRIRSGKKNKIDKIIGDEAEVVILDYMKMQNRPYSVQNVFDNLHGKIAKAHVQKVMDLLALDNKLLCKEYGKAKIYLCSQVDDQNATNFIDIPKEELKNLEAIITELENEQKRMRLSVQRFEETKSEIEILQKLEKDILNSRIELSKLESSVNKSGPVDLSSIKDMMKNHQRLHELWYHRKKMCNSLISSVSALVEMTSSAIIKELGLDTDEDSISPDAYKNYQ